MSRKIRFPLHITLLTLILILTLTVTGTLAWYNFKKSSNAAIAIAQELLTQVNQTLLAKIDHLFQPVLALSNRVSELPNLADKPELTNHPSTWFFVQALESAPQIYSIYMGYSDGDFYQIIQILPDDTERQVKLGAPKGTRFALRRILTKEDGSKAEIWKFLDQSHRTIGSRMVKSITYDPRTRPWYAKTEKQEGLVKTPPYVFTSNQSLGLTVARRFDGEIPGVFGVDLTLKSVSEFLAAQHVGKTGKAFLFDFNGNLVAHPDPDVCIQVEQIGPETHVLPTRLYDLEDPIIDKLYSQFISTQGTIEAFSFEVKGETYMARITRIVDSILDDGYVAVFAPQDDFTDTMTRVLNDTKLFTAILLAIILPAAFLIARSMAAPLKKLAKEALEIQHFRLHNTSETYSFVSEIDLLADSFSTMKGALKTFGQYVPKSLVRQIVESDESPTLGGNRRPLSILFTDIADFTTISESMDPETLMHQTSEYFQLMGSGLLENGATIDKFIGDAIMAFWNAPSDDPQHTKHACTAALSVAALSNELNQTWAAQGKNIFYTRIGIHTGECIVGNVGSSDRMNYTAMGDAVNLASRLEGLNKTFGTQILVSQIVHDMVKDDFVFCPAANVIPKGSTVPMSIYTLLGTKPEDELPHPASPDDLRFCDAWSVAYGLFLNRQFADAARAFAAMKEQFNTSSLPQHYLDHAQNYAQTPPDDDWQGIEIFTTK